MRAVVSECGPWSRSGLRVWSLEQWSQNVVPGAEVVSECGPQTSSGLRVWSLEQKWSQSVVLGPAVVSECGPWTRTGLRVWSLEQQWSQSVVLRPSAVGSPGSLSKMQISCPAPIYCLRNSGICVLTNPRSRLTFEDPWIRGSTRKSLGTLGCSPTTAPKLSVKPTQLMD